MDRLQLIANRIVPIPQSVQMLEGAPLELESNFLFSVPTAAFGPIKTAGERIQKLLGGKKGKSVPVTLSIEPAPFAMRCPEEGYRLRVTADEVKITGFGEKGLLYGVITLEQLLANDKQLPPLEVTDYPDNPYRGIKEECRYGSNMMQLAEWIELLEDMASKKMNTLGLAIYGCWTIQYDGKISEFLYMPIDSRPELKTPMTVKYYSPKEQKWVHYEKLPPIFEEDLLHQIFAKARDLGIQICPQWNSFGHNTLLPTVYPETAPVNADGVPQMYGFCTSSPATYELLFDIFDRLVDQYMLPYGMDMINLCLDEVHAGNGRDINNPFDIKDPWCQCPVCRQRDKGDIFIDHAIKLMSYLKKKGIKTVMMACDMLQEGRVSKLGWLGDRLMDAIRKADLQDTLLIDWWSYHDIPSKNWIKSLYPEKGFRSVVAPWNGYHTWSITLQPLGNAQILSDVNYRDGGDGILAYAMWDRACDRVHDAIAEYGWNYKKTGTPEDITRRYAARHFPTQQDLALRAYKLMDASVEQRHTTRWSVPEKDNISKLDLLTYQLSPYNFSYVKAGKPYPRAFLDEALTFILSMREEVETALTEVSDMSREAVAIFNALANDPACDAATALLQLGECLNYQVLAEDWLAILKMQDLCESEQYDSVAEIAKNRYDARLALMKHMEQYKERSVAEGMGLRQQSIFLQMFADIEKYARKSQNFHWDLMNIYEILSERSFWLR